MPRAFKTVNVTFIPGEPLRGYVESWSRPGEKHMVDLGARQPLGMCSCEDWSCKRWPDFKDTLRPVRCRHLTAFREAYTNRKIREDSGFKSDDGE